MNFNYTKQNGERNYEQGRVQKVSYGVFESTLKVLQKQRKKMN